MLLRYFNHPKLFLPKRLRFFHSSGFICASKKVTHQFNLADIGEGITECEIIKWNIQPQATVQSFDALCEVQSDKASVEITSPYDGKVTEFLVQEGEIAKVGSGLCTIEVEEEVSETSEEDSTSAVTPDAPTTFRPTPSRTERRPHPLDPSNVPSPLSKHDVEVLATPSIRHFAKNRGVDLALLAPGSGKDGRIERSDIEAYVSQSSSTTTDQDEPAHSTQDTIVEIGRTRYGMWKAMEKSLAIPHFGYSTSLDLTNLHNMLPSLNKNIPQHFLPESSHGPNLNLVDPSSICPLPTPPTIAPAAQYTKLTYLPFLIKTLAKAMEGWPLLRSSITPVPSGNDSSQKPTLTIRPYADISLALSTPTGLYTPTLQNVGQYNVFEIMSKVKALGNKGRQIPHQLTPQDMPKRGGTITISNVGAIGKGEYAHPVLVPGGGVAIVAVGRADWIWDVSDARPNGERRLKIGISWSADHRVVEGAELAAFVESWRDWIESPWRMVGEGR